MQFTIKIFTHFEKLTNLSGLRLNADKTEIIQNKSLVQYRVLNYNGQGFNVSTLNDVHVKLNGAYLSFDEGNNIISKNNETKINGHTVRVDGVLVQVTGATFWNRTPCCSG